jgi:hypothetical protein
MNSQRSLENTDQFIRRKQIARKIFAIFGREKTMHNQRSDAFVVDLVKDPRHR